MELRYASSSPLAVAMTVAAPMRCQLHRIGAHSACATMDQDRLSLFQVTVGEESLPRSLGGHRHRCCLLVDGFLAMAAGLTARYSAYAPPVSLAANTASPGAYAATSLPICSTTPENS